MFGIDELVPQFAQELAASHNLCAFVNTIVKTLANWILEGKVFLGR